MAVLAPDRDAPGAEDHARCRLTAAKARAKAKAKVAEAEATVDDSVDFGRRRRCKHERPLGEKPTARHPAKPGGFQAHSFKKRPTEPPFMHLRTVKSGASLALLCSFHGALRLTRCTHRHHLANLVTTCGRICLRVQRELLGVQRLGNRVRLAETFRRFHGGSRLPARWLVQKGFEISESAWAAGWISELSTAKSPSATMPTSRLLRSTTGKRLT